jgi:hypothetical protein
MPLSLKQIEYICLHENTDGKKCRYLARDSKKSNNWICLKKTNKRPLIDKEVNDYKLTMKNYMTEEMPPLGDNCEGFPIMKHLTQGI